MLHIYIYMYIHILYNNSNNILIVIIMIIIILIYKYIQLIHIMLYNNIEHYQTNICCFFAAYYVNMPSSACWRFISNRRLPARF